MAFRYLRLLWQRPAISSLFPLPPVGGRFQELLRTKARVQTGT